MGVGSADGSLGGGPGHGSIEGGVAGAAEQHAGRVHDRQLARVCGIQGAQVFAVAHFAVPGLAKGVGLAVEMRQRGFIRCRHGAQDADPARQHDLRSGHPRHEGDLGVPVLHGQRRRSGNPVAAVGELFDFLFRHVQAGAAAEPFQLDPLHPDFLEQLQHGRGGAGVKLGLHPPVAELRPAADRRAADQYRGHLGRGVQLEFPHKGGAPLAGEQAAGFFADDFRMQRNPAVRGVVGLAAAAGFGVERPAGDNKGGDVGDRVEDLVALTGTVDEEGLVQVGGGRRIDGHKIDMREIQLRQFVPGDRLLGFPERVLGESARQLQRRAQRVERLGKVVSLLVDIRGQSMMGHENQISFICAISLGS